MRTPSSRRAQHPLRQSEFWLHSAAQEQSDPKQVQAVGFLRPAVSRQQSASRAHACPTEARHIALLAQNSGMLHARVPSVSDTQHPLAQSVPLPQAAVHTCPTPVSSTHRVVTPRSAQQSASDVQVSPGRAKQVAVHVPLGEHACPAAQVPHDPVPQLFGPQLRPPQLGVQVGVQLPRAVSHTRPAVHVPQVPPHPSEPQKRPAQLGVQHWPVIGLHEPPDGHSPHIPPQPSGPHMRPAQLGVQVIIATQEVPLQLCPAGHTPHTPPHPSSPQVRPEQLGTQARSGVGEVSATAPSTAGEVSATAPSSVGQPAQTPKPTPLGSHVWTPMPPPAQRHAWVAFGVQPALIGPLARGSPHPSAATTNENHAHRIANLLWGENPF